MLKKILLVLALLVVCLLVVIQTRPATYHVMRSSVVPAAPEVVYAMIIDFHAWKAWSPWEHRDPNLQRTFAGSGVGATYHWTGNSEVGEGQMTITEATPVERIAIRLDFIKPFASTSQTVFALAPAEGGTNVTWTMDGKNDFISKAFTLMGSMDSMIGPDFEKGLAGLATATASVPPSADSTAATPAPQ